MTVLFGVIIGQVQAEPCFDMYRQSNFERAVEPGLIIPATEEVPEHCVVRGVVNRSIEFELRMPTTGWNGRFLMMGTGGSSGYIAPTDTELHRGFATSSTNTGHRGSDFEYAAQPEAALDYAFRAVHLAALTSKALIQAYYEDDIRYSYYQGCSNGGRQGMIEATRYPDDFDGIVAGAPVFQIAKEFLLWTTLVDRAQRANPLTKAHLALLDEASRGACDAMDGVEDAVINDPRECTTEHFDPTDLLCAAGQSGDDCLTDGQLETVKTHYRGVVDVDGTVLSPGLMPGAEGAGDWAMWALPGASIPTTGERIETSINEMASARQLRYWVYRDTGYDPDEFDIFADRQDLARASAVLDVNTADLTAFEDHGGKILMYQGWNDYPLRPQRAIDYLAAVNAANGGAKKARDFFRLYMVPGMVHCAGGPGAWSIDYLGPLVDWVEQGEAPEHLFGAQPDAGFTRRHCAYPELAHFAGGDPTRADSYVCQ
jgi:feruloyl esterase